jgi:CRISPR-associated protein Csb3
MTITTPASTIRLHLDPTNPGQVFACCGVLELADRAWRGAEGWFEERADFFCLAPLEMDTARNYGPKALLEEIASAKLTNTRITEAQLNRRAEIRLEGKKTKRTSSGEPARAELAKEMAELDALWDIAKNDALHLGPPFDIRLDWYLDDRSGAGRFKTWAGQQSITQIAFELKDAVTRASFDDSETEWLFARVPCDKSLHFDALGASADLDVGFSFDPLNIRSPEKRALLQLLAFIGLQRFTPRRRAGEAVYEYATWRDPLVPEVAHAAARGIGVGSARAFEFRLHNTKYLKSFLPAQPQGERE